MSKVIRLVLILLSIVGASAVVQLSAAYAEGNPTGKIIETMNSGGYSYALIEKDSTKSWVAVPQIVLSVGDEVEFSPGLEMGQYTSKTLGRTFENIIFSGGVVAIKRAKKAIESEKPETTITVEKAAGSNAYTIEELYKDKSTLAGEKVVVRGKVYKVSKFMGAVWIRVKDGTGSRKRGDHKLVITSQEKAEKDEIITASGIMAVDKNFGGLSYEVVIEDAVIQKE